jgi:hypothetical protein
LLLSCTLINTHYYYYYYYYYYYSQCALFPVIYSQFQISLSKQNFHVYLSQGRECPPYIIVFRQRHRDMNLTRYASARLDLRSGRLFPHCALEKYPKCSSHMKINLFSDSNGRWLQPSGSHHEDVALGYAHTGARRTHRTSPIIFTDSAQCTVFARTGCGDSFDCRPLISKHEQFLLISGLQLNELCQPAGRNTIQRVVH